MEPIGNVLIHIGDEDIQLKDTEFFNSETGQIHCRKCGEKTSIFFGDTRRIVRCLCKCGKIEKEREEKQKEIEEKQKRFRELQDNSLLSERYKGISFDTTYLDRDESFVTAFNRCKKYCEVSKEVYEKGKGIYLFGQSGTGKSHLMACMVNELSKQNYTCLFTNFFKIIQTIHKTFSRGAYAESIFLNKLQTIDFLFIDDLGTERVQNNGEDNWVQERVYDILNDRYNAMKPTIFSSNLSKAELITKRGFLEKTVDRIREMAPAGATMEIKGDTYRMINQKQAKSEKEIF